MAPTAGPDPPGTLRCRTCLLPAKLDLEPLLSKLEPAGSSGADSLSPPSPSMGPSSAPSLPGGACGTAWAPVTPCLGMLLPQTSAELPLQLGDRRVSQFGWEDALLKSKGGGSEGLSALGLTASPAVLGDGPPGGATHWYHINKGCTSYPEAVPGSDCARLAPKQGPPPHPNAAPPRLGGPGPHLPPSPPPKLPKHLQPGQLILNALFSILKTSIFNN